MERGSGLLGKEGCIFDGFVGSSTKRNPLGFFKESNKKSGAPLTKRKRRQNGCKIKNERVSKRGKYRPLAD